MDFNLSAPICIALYFEKVWDFLSVWSGATDISHFSRKIQYCDWYRIINRAMRDSGILPTAGSFSYIIYCL